MSLRRPAVLLAVDPGKTQCGVALFIGTRLRAAALLSASNTFLLGASVEEWWHSNRFRFALTEGDKSDFVDQLVCEGQQVYPGLRSANPNDLLPLAYLDGAVQARIKAHQTLMPLPREWKGALKKEIFTRQILMRLTPDERVVIDEVPCIKSKLHNVIDAAGLGLWALGALRTVPDVMVQ